MKTEVRQASLLSWKEVSLRVVYKWLINDLQLSNLSQFCSYNMYVTSGTTAGRPEAPNTLRDDPWIMAASYEAAALPQSLQGLLRPV